MRRIVVLLMLFFATISAHATHIVGGELEFVHLGGDQYRIGLVKYFDAVNGNPDAVGNIATVGIFSKRDNREILTIDLPFREDRPVPYTDPECAIGTLLVRRIYYSLEVTLNRGQFTDSEGYYMVWERCCRNNIISNIVAPENAGLTMYLEFPPLVRNGFRFDNSAPTIFPPLSDYVCINQPFFFDFSGEDPDGDELRYRLTVPINGNSDFNEPRPAPQSAPYSLVEFVPGININNVVPGPSPLSINQDGILSVTASQVGLYVFAVAVEEYRNGVKIGEVRRDYQLLVIDCPTATAPNTRFRANAEPDFYREGTTIILDPQDDKCGTLFVTDSNPNTVINARAEAVNFNDASGFLLENGGNISGTGDQLELDVCFPECPLDPADPTKPYIVDFIVSDNSCAVPLLDTVRVNVLVRNPPNDPPTFVPDATFDTASGCYIAEVQVGENLVINTRADDSNGDELTVRANNLPPGASYGGQTQGTPILNGVLNWTPACDVLPAGQTEQTFEMSFVTTEERQCDSPERVETCLRIKVVANPSDNRAPEIEANLTFDPTTNQYIADTVFVGEIIDFETIATDINNDSLFVEFIPQNFNLSGRNITYTPVEGIASLRSAFNWQTTCQDLENPESSQTFLMNFRVSEVDVCGNADSTDQIQVRVVIAPRPNVAPTIRASLTYDSTLMAYCDTLTFGDNYRFTLTGDDQNGDSILITGNGVGFSFQDYQMQFSETSGRPVLTTDFTWQPDCENENIPIGEPINLRFRVREFNECGVSLEEEIDVKLVVLPEDPDNTAPESRPELSDFNTSEQLFVDTLRVGESINFDVLGLDSESDSVLLFAQGIGFDLSDFGMSFPSVSGFAPIESTFLWQTLCEYLDGANEREFLIDFIVRDFNSCQESLEDVKRVKLVLLFDAQPNNPPEILANLTFDQAEEVYIYPVEVDEQARFNVTGNDVDNSVIEINGEGVGFSFENKAMEFEDVIGLPTLISDFRWRPSCADLGFQNADTSYLAEFVVTDIANCDEILRDTIRVRFDLTANRQNLPPTVELRSDTDSITMVDESTCRVRAVLGRELRLTAIADDTNNETIELIARGEGFDLTTFGMQFEDVSGLPVLESEFTWTPDCGILEGASSREFEVVFTATDNTTCGVRSSTPKKLIILVEDEVIDRDFKPANVFTPNNDGINDTFFIPNLPTSDCTDQFLGVKIYNRWGELLFESDQIDFEWDGGSLPAGQYYFIIEYQNESYKNWLTLLRD